MSFVFLFQLYALTPIHSYHYTGSTFAITEIDGVRMLSEDVCDLIQRVPGKYPHLFTTQNILTANLESSASIFRPGSTSPSAILYDAWESFTNKSPKADESIRSIRPELAKAVDECIAAAGQEWEPYWQRRLLNVCLPCYDIFLTLGLT